uniref:Uncharacterized protein n=1 Tax=Rhizophora mucronata TaxID=61149 RepID=A0A2P2N1Z7_RHIMU
MCALPWLLFKFVLKNGCARALVVWNVLSIAHKVGFDGINDVT